MLSKLVRAAPRLLQQTARLNQVPAVYRLSSNQSAPVIESHYKPSGNVPTDESYHQIPIVIDGQEWVCDPENLEQPYPLIVSLDEISIEKKQAAGEEGEAAAAQEELPPEFQVKTLEDKIKVWFGENMPTKYDDQRPERDLVNYPRIPPQLIDPPTTRLYFLPESWFKFFESKTGRTGGYVFGTTFITFLVSKEIFCYNDNAHSGAALFLIAYMVVTKYGKQINDYMTSHMIKEKQGWIDWQDGMKKLLKSHVQELKQIEERSINPGPIYEAKRENLLLQQEAEYRRRLMEVYQEVKRKLDYQVAIEDAKKNFTRKHLVNWVIDNVNKNVNADLEKAVLKQCVLDLKVLSEKRRNAI